MYNNGKTGSDIEATRPVLRYNHVPVWSTNYVQKSPAR